MKNNLDDRFMEIGESMVDSINYNSKMLEYNKKKIPKIHYIVAAIAIFITISMLTVYATSYVSKKFFHNDNNGIGVDIAVDEGYANTNIKEVTDNGITVKITGVVAGHNTILVGAEYYILDNSEYSEPLVEEIMLKDDEGKQYNSKLSREYLWWAKDFYTNDHYNENYEFEGNIEKTRQMTLLITKIGDVSGKWEFEFELQYPEFRVYELNKVIDIEGWKMQIDKITIDAISSTIEFSWDQYIYNGIMHIKSNLNYKYVTENVPDSYDGINFLGYGDHYAKSFIRPYPHGAVLTLVVIKSSGGYRKYEYEIPLTNEYLVKQ